MTQPTVEDLLFTGTAPTVKWETPGTVQRITVTDKTTRQRRDKVTNELLYWDEAKLEPKMQILLTGPCEVKSGKTWTKASDPELDNDDGVRTLYIAGRSKKNPGSTMDALRKAMRAAGARAIEIGSIIEMTHESGIGTPDKPRKYSATYTAPEPADAFDENDE
jgi:hypothetical protein